MERGTVKWFDEVKGFGFIISDIGNKEYFVHNSNVNSMSKTLEKGERVEFEIGEGPKGAVAKNVSPILEEEV